MSKESQRNMINEVEGTLKASKEMPSWTHPATGIDVRNTGGIEKDKRFGIISRVGDKKDSLAVYPAEGEDTAKLYLRSMNTGGITSGKSTRAYVDRDRTGKRQGQHVNVTTDYNSKPMTIGSSEFPKGSKTTVTVYDDEGKIIRQREHKSNDVGLSPLVSKIVTHGIDAQFQKIKDSKESAEPQPIKLTAAQNEALLKSPGDPEAQRAFMETHGLKDGDEPVVEVDGKVFKITTRPDDFGTIIMSPEDYAEVATQVAEPMAAGGEEHTEA